MQPEGYLTRHPEDSLGFYISLEAPADKVIKHVSSSFNLHFPDSYIFTIPGNQFPNIINFKDYYPAVTIISCESSISK